MIAQHRQEIVFGQETQLDDQPGQRRLLLLLQFHDPLQLFFGEEPPFNQPFGKAQFEFP